MNRDEILTEIPWRTLSTGQKIKASPSIESDIWWLRLNNGKYALRVNFHGIVNIDLAQIRFSGADANLTEIKDRSVFILILREDADIEIFYRFAKDLISVPVSTDIQKYANALFMRMKQWMKFLQRLKKKEIDIRTQIGLIAELKFMEYLHTEYFFRYEELLSSWQGPEKTSKDFIFEDFFVEVKACFNDEDVIHISNERQLSRESKELYLVCYKFIQDSAAENLLDVISSLRYQIHTEEDSLVVVFEEKLLAAGYNPAILYENLISVKELHINYFQVRDDFPCITVADIPGNILNVKYDIELAGILKYLVQDLGIRKQ